jgi:hypothetical protein
VVVLRFASSWRKTILGETVDKHCIFNPSGGHTMKTRFLTASLSVVLTLAGALQLQAQSRNPAYDAYLPLNLVGQNFRDAAEREKAIIASLSAAHYDANRDGKLDAKEQAAWEKRIRGVLETNPKFMKSFDQNRDNILSDAEWSVAYSEVFEARSVPAGAKQ